MKYLNKLKLKNKAAITFTLQVMALLEIQLNIVPKTKRAISPFYFDKNFINSAIPNKIPSDTTATITPERTPDQNPSF